LSILDTIDGYVDIDAEDFLELVYGDREGWIDLPAKVGGYWVPFHTEWPNDAAIGRRIDSSLRDGEDLYYSVAMFSQRGRRYEDVLPSGWLWADLDEVHPTEAARIGLLPTVAVESSPGRYQALWELDHYLRPTQLEKLNRGLSYALNADRSGWDLTQVLRIPGTRNFKYPKAPLVRCLWANDMVYDPREVWKIVKGLIPAAELVKATDVVIPRKPIPAKAKALLRTPASQIVEGERSHRMWELECMLAESGLEEDEIFELVWNCRWNKWAGINTGRDRLRREVKKAMGAVARKQALKQRERKEQADGSGRQSESDRRLQRRAEHRDVVESDGVSESEEEPLSADDPRGDGESGSLPFVGYSSFMAMAMEEPKWLVENIWTASSHGIIGGEPKTQKTTLAIALALSVASGLPFLGDERYPVGQQGPVLMLQEENAPWMMQDRMRKIAAHMGLISRKQAHIRPSSAGALGRSLVELDMPADVPLRLLNNFGFDLDIEEHRDMLWAEVDQLKPVLVLLDPLYLILGGADENHSAQLRPFLKWLMHLRYEFNCAVAVIHHFHKQANGPGVVQRRAGQRLMGSATLHGWVDSAIYASAMEEERQGWTKTQVETEFRSMAPQRPIEMALHMGDPGDLKMEVELGRYDLMGLIKRIVADQPGVTVVALAEQLGKDKRTVLGMVRGTDGFIVKEGTRGRGKSHTVFLGTEE
jgi:hypothetical protein